jgi:hypothetical protein
MDDTLLKWLPFLENNIKDWFSENDTKAIVALLLFLDFVFTESVFKT